MLLILDEHLYNLGMKNAIKNAIAHYGSITNMARATGVTVQAIRFYRDGRTPCNPKVALKVERDTNGAISRYDLRPDAKEIWG